LSGFWRKSFCIPVKYSKSWFGDINSFKKKNSSYEYVIVFNKRNESIKVNICKSDKRYTPQISGEDKTIGVDVNIKHNLFSLSNGESYDYNRRLLNDFSELSSKIDRLKINKTYEIGRKKQYKLDALRLKIVKSNEHLISSMCKGIAIQGIRHIVMEDLDNSFGKGFAKDKNNSDIKFNRIMDYLNLSSLKQMVERIGANYDIGVSTIHASYTSKMCSICGCIADENRPSQEEFDCIECGYADNADHNAGINIKNRVDVAVLRDKLLKQNDNGTYSPKRIERQKIKETLLSHRASPILRVET